MARMGEAWGAEARHPHVIPMKHCEKCVMSCEPEGDYVLHDAIVNAKHAIEAVRRDKRARGRLRRDGRPPARACAADATRMPDAECVCEDVAPPVRAAALPTLDEWRDMSGDAITSLEARARGVHAQCTLASVRNLRRNPDYSVRRLSERCIGAEYVDDIRYPDWPALILPVLREGEVVKRAQVRSVRAEELSDFRAGVVVMEGHVVCFFYDGDGGFRVYDNDSEERQEGRPRRMRADEIIDEMSGGTNNAVIGAIQNTSDLSRRLGPAITTQVHTRRGR